MTEKQAVSSQGTRHAEAIQAEIDRRAELIKARKHLTLVWVHPVRRVISFGKVCKNEQK